jgi:hypothetical protein
MTEVLSWLLQYQLRFNTAGGGRRRRLHSPYYINVNYVSAAGG